MRCKDAMKTGIEAFREDDPVQVIAMRMRDMGTEFIPICDPAGRPVGMVTDFDIVRGVCAEDLLASKVRASEVMEDHPPTCFDTDPVERAEEVMNDSHKPRVLVCEDVVTTGGSVQEVIAIVRQCGGVVAGVGYVVDRSGGRVRFPLDDGGAQHAVLHMDVVAYRPEACPLCAAGVSVVKPGSRGNYGAAQ